MGKKLSDARVLITGAGGFIGSHLCEFCLSAGAEVRAFVHYNSRNDWGMLEDLDRKKLRELDIMVGDLRDPSAVRRAIRGCQYVFHLGALIGIPYSYVNPSDVVHTNILGTLHVLEASLEFHVDRLVQTSTSEVYGTAKFVPIDESHPLNPQSPYAASKVGSDKLAESFYRTYALPVTVLRPFNTYGPRQSPRAVVPTIITQALRSATIRLGSVGPKRDLTYVEDTVRGFVAAAGSKRSLGETVQIGTNRESSVDDLVGLIGRIMGKELKIAQEPRRKRPKGSEVQRLLASNKRADRLLGWRPKVPLELGLERTVEWFRNRADSYRRNFYYI